MRAAITGASGFVGQRLVDLLRKDCWEVLPITHRLESVNSWNIIDPPSSNLLESLEGVDVFFHLAAYLPKDYSDIGSTEQCIQVNGLGALNALKIAEKAGIKKFIYVSTANMIKVVNGYIPDDLVSYECSYAPAYFSSKALGELLTKSFDTKKTSLLIVRPSSLYSIDRPASIMAYIKSCLINGQPMQLFNQGAFSADYIHVDDFIWALEKLGASDIVGEINIGSGVATSNLELATSALNRKGMARDVMLQFIDGGERTRHPGFGAVQISSRLRNLGYNPLQTIDELGKIISCD